MVLRRDRIGYLTSTISLGLALIVGFTAGASPASAASSVQPITVPGNSTPISGVDQRLPALTASSYFSAGSEFATQIRSYHDSGDYEADQQAVATAAEKFLGPWLASTCGDTSAAMCRPAVIFDIDETLLTSYQLYADNGFALHGNQWRNSILTCSAVAIAPTRNLLKAAQQLGAAVILLTGRKESARLSTETCLRKRGITGWRELITTTPETASLSNQAFKSQARAALEAKGWRLGFTIGDQISDLTGGHVAQGFLLPNPMYYSP